MKSRSIICSVIVVLLTLNSLLFMIGTNSTAYADEISSDETSQVLPSEYCMRDDYIVYAQNQDNHGFCWNFAATMAASTTIMKATGEYYDFSELWVGVSLLNYSTQFKKMGAGGTLSYQYDSLKQSGFMLETDLPYQYSYTVSNENATDYYNFYEHYSNDDLARCIVKDKDTNFTRTEVDEIKNHIYNHGSVYLTFTFRKGFIESDGAYYLEPNQKDTTSNHAVSVIGWDDNYQKEFYLDGSSTPTVFKGAWIILNSYTEKNGNDGISFVFYDDANIGVIQGYRYEMDTSHDLYFYDKIESGYAYPTSLKGKYYGDFTAEMTATKQKNIFYDDVDLEYSYTASEGASVKEIDIYLDGHNVTSEFNIRVDNDKQRFYISKDHAAYGQYKVLVTYGNDKKTDTFLNNFFVTHGLVGEEIEYDYDNNSFSFNPGRDLEFYSFMSSDKNYVVYTNKLSGTVTFLPTEQSVYSEKNMSIPSISYEITDGEACTETYVISSESGYDLEYNFVFEYYDDITLQPVNVYYNLGGGVNNSKNYAQELASPTEDLVLYEPYRPGYTFEGWYLDYGNGSKKIAESDGVYYVSWDDIHHMGETPTLNASSYYKKYYNNSNTVFVYAHWEENEYYNVDLTIVGDGTAQIENDILISSEDSVRYLLKPKSGWCLSGLAVNGTPLCGDDFVEAAKYGLLLENLSEDISITATFSNGVYLSLKSGENIKDAYVIGTSNGVSKKFYDGDFIPSEYFKSLTDRFDPIIDIRPILPLEGAERLPIDDLTPVLPWIPAFGTQFSVVVELFDNTSEYAYLLDDVASYTVVEQGIFKKNIVIDSNDKLVEIDVGSAQKKPMQKTEVKYSVGAYVEDHYISDDINATSGYQNSATYYTGQIVYLFIRKPEDTFVYTYRAPDDFESIGNRWYRKAMYVNPDEPQIGRISVYRSHQTYTVTWANWDGSVIYKDDCKYGSIPSFYNKNSPVKDYPVRPEDELYTYEFTGWDKVISAVKSDVTYTATYKAVLKEYTVAVEPTENGTVTPGGNNTMNSFDRHTYIFTPDVGYKVKDVVINGESVGAVSSYTFSDVYSNQTLRVEFEKVKYSVDVIIGENGGADISGITEVEHGSSITVNITPNENFTIDFIKVNGVSADVSQSFTATDITKDTVIEIAFKQSVFSISTTTSPNGSITPSLTVALGESAKIDFSANIGYRVKDVKIDGVSIGSVDHYTFVNVEDNHIVHVEYELDKMLIIIASGVAAIWITVVILILVIVNMRKRYTKITKRVYRKGF